MSTTESHNRAAYDRAVEQNEAAMLANYRDVLARDAMNRIVGSMTFVESPNGYGDAFDAIARGAYECADAMLRARKSTP